MKKLLMLSTMFIFLVASATAQQAVKVSSTVVEAKASYSFDKMTHDFGTIEKDVPAKAVFTITNYGDKPMNITNVKGSCGCTATAFDNKPIAPGNSTEITATYNAKKIGNFTKTVKVTVDSEEKPIMLKIRGDVAE